MAKRLISALMCVAVLSLPIAGFSQEEEGEEDIEYGSGTVVEVKGDLNEIVINKYDYETDEEVKIKYNVSADIKIENIDSWKNIPSGAYVDIEYAIDKNGKRVASYISVYETESDEPETEWAE